MRDIQGFEVKGILSKGQQIIYLPSHIELSMLHLNWFYPNGAQPGFVTSGPCNNDFGADDGYFCRYWQYDFKRGIYVPELRTVANSELTPGRNLIVQDTFNQMHIDWLIKQLLL